MDERILWHPYRERYLPYIYRVLDITPNTIVFMGQFRIEEGALPVEGILIHKDSWVHARIDSKEILEQEQEPEKEEDMGGYDEDVGGYIRFFPEDECIQIHYTVIKDLPTKEDAEACMKHIEAQGKDVWERSEEIRREREERELQEWIVNHKDLYRNLVTSDATPEVVPEVVEP